MNQRHIVMVTCEQWPDLSDSDSLLANELRKRGHRVTARAWTTTPLSEFTSADVVVLRANWDFHHHLTRFEDWLAQVDASTARLENSASLVYAHNRKSYLEHYAEQGIAIPTTGVAERFDTGTVRQWMSAHNFEKVVCKPAWGASGFGVQLLTRDDLTEAQVQWETGEAQRGIIIQEFVPEIASGEISLVYFAGEFSHAFRRTPAAGEFRINSEYGGRMDAVPDIDTQLLDAGECVNAALPSPATYLRIDMVLTGSGPLLMEVEVNEPALGLNLADGSASRFADALTKPYS